MVAGTLFGLVLVLVLIVAFVAAAPVSTVTVVAAVGLVVGAGLLVVSSSMWLLLPFQGWC